MHWIRNRIGILKETPLQRKPKFVLKQILCYNSLTASTARSFELTVDGIFTVEYCEIPHCICLLTAFRNEKKITINRTRNSLVTEFWHSIEKKEFVDISLFTNE